MIAYLKQVSYQAKIILTFLWSKSLLFLQHPIGEFQQEKCSKFISVAACKGPTKYRIVLTQHAATLLGTTCWSACHKYIIICSYLQDVGWCKSMTKHMTHEHTV